MSVITVTSDIRYEAIQSTDPDAPTILRDWYNEHAEAEQQAEPMDLTEFLPTRHWFLRDPKGHIFLVHPADLPVEFTVVAGSTDPMAAFEEAFNAPDEPEAEEDLELANKISTMLAEFRDLVGLARDDEHASAEDAIGWAKSRFLQVFEITPE